MNEKHYWTIDSWMSEPGQNRSAFRIWMSPAFIVDSIEVMGLMDPDRVRLHSIELVKAAGWKSVSDYTGYLTFKEDVGLNGISAPGNCCCLFIDYGHHRAGKGALLQPHNIDGPLQQATLMALWMFWAKAVESHVAQRDREKEPRP